MGTILQLQHGNISSLIAALGPEDAVVHNLENWSLKPLQDQSDVPGNQTLVRALAREFARMDIDEAFAPNVTRGSGNIIDTKDLLDMIWLDDPHVLHRNQYIHADGLFLGLGQAFVVSAGGCGIIVAGDGEHLCVAHAGRDSLIARSAVIGKPTRKHISVVDSIIEQFLWRGTTPRNITMTMLFSIPARGFEHSGDHPVHGAYNRALADFIGDRWPGGVLREGDKTFLDLDQVFVEQARQAGVTKAWAAHSLAEHPRLAHTRDGKSPDRRNLVIVKRES